MLTVPESLFNMFPGMFTNGASRKRPLEIQKQTVKRAAGPLRNASNSQAKSSQTRKVTIEPAKRKAPRSSAKTAKNSPISLLPTPKQSRATSSPQPLVDFGLEDSDSEEDLPSTPKKVKFNDDHDRDIDRLVRCQEAFDPQQTQEITMVHAAEIPILDQGTKYESACPDQSEPVFLELHYPSVAQPEK